MKKIVFLFIVFGCFLRAQSPKIMVKGTDSSLVRITQMKVDVKVVGNRAYTTTEMHFFNSSSRDREAELMFPLPDGVSVSGYAIDINGKMRDAVPVNKNKGKQVFEAIENRRVDPGLLEKVDGNNFKTRIYPILPNKERVVVIKYEQELLPLENNFMGYQMVSSLSYQLDFFECNVRILNDEGKTPVITREGEVLIIKNMNKVYEAGFKERNYRPDDHLLIKIPYKQNHSSVFMEENGGQYYFYTHLAVEKERKNKVKPKTIGLLWDVSLSSDRRDIKKEIEVLETYFKKLNEVEVSLFFVGLSFEKRGDFKIKNGEWGNLKKILENVIYDGGTCFSKIQFPKKDEILFFTDGLSSLSKDIVPLVSTRLYTFTSSVRADYAKLKALAMPSGGGFLNLNELNAEEVIEKLLYRELKFLGIKKNPLLLEVYPLKGTTINNQLSVSGISMQPVQEVTLLFGYDSNEVFEKKVSINFEKQFSKEVKVERLWAQMKIAALEVLYDQNAEEIETIGKKYGIVTKNTSLIVLESVQDYLRYDILPPAELREEFDRIRKEQREAQLAKEKKNLENIDHYFKNLNDWWSKDIKYDSFSKKIKKKEKVGLQSNPTGDERVIIGTVTDASSNPLLEVSVTVKGTSMGVVTNFDGGFVISARNGDILVFNYVGFQPVELVVSTDSNYQVVMTEDHLELNSVVVVSGYAIDSEEVVEAVAAEAIEERVDGAVDRDGFIDDAVAGLDISNETDAQINNSERERRSQIKTKSWNPDRIYLKALDQVADSEKYATYIELRKVNRDNPSFYFDVANYFYEKGNKKEALQVLTSIAELDLENHQLFKSLLYVLRQWGENKFALFVAEKIVLWRAHEPQSYRDLALVLEDDKQYRAAFDMLVKSLNIAYYEEMNGVYKGFEDVVLMDLNRVIVECRDCSHELLDEKYLKALPVEVRVVLNWNQMNTDIDLHVIEPTGEECYYSHKNTAMGGRFSKDFTNGYGPEQYLLRNAVKGKYKIKTDFYGENKLTELGPATVLVEIYTRQKNGKLDRKLQTIQLGKIKENQFLAEIEIE